MKKEKLEIGQIVNTFGIKGFVKIYPYVDDITRFDDLRKVFNIVWNRPIIRIRAIIRSVSVQAVCTPLRFNDKSSP